MQFYSQYGEDKLINEIFSKSDTGVCIEVGANDGVLFSNTKLFEELGWTCVLVEPTPHLCAKIRQNRTALLFENAASSAQGQLEFTIYDANDLYSSVESNATMKHKLDGSERKVTVQCRTLDSIIQESGVGDIKFVSIDVEGHELAVLQGFNLRRWNPELIILEDELENHPSASKNHMRASGYCWFYRSGGNDWYCRSVQEAIRMLWRMRSNEAFLFRGLVKAMLPGWLLSTALKIKRHRMA
jgi:FkbM family methyltransferase